MAKAYHDIPAHSRVYNKIALSPRTNCQRSSAETGFTRRRPIRGGSRELHVTARVLLGARQPTSRPAATSSPEQRNSEPFDCNIYYLQCQSNRIARFFSTMDIEDFHSVFRGAEGGYNKRLVEEISKHQAYLGGKLFFQRLLELLGIKCNAHLSKTAPPHAILTMSQGAEASTHPPPKTT